jgi:hypothetical protein
MAEALPMPPAPGLLCSARLYSTGSVPFCVAADQAGRIGRQGG